MNQRNWSILLYAIAVLSYAAWKGKVSAISHTNYFNSRGEKVSPVAARSMEEAAGLGAAWYYTDAGGVRQIDIQEQVQTDYNWTAAGKVLGFGIALVLLLSLIRYLISQQESNSQRLVQ